MRLIDLTGQTFGRLTVTVYAGKSKWHCLCSCGNTASVNGHYLTTGYTRSCGCLRNEKTAERSINHGHERNGQASPELMVFRNMHSRCYNPTTESYALYGARGIKVCDRWGSFQHFLDDMGPRPSPRHSIDRINNDGDYEPGNCRWATNKEQANNTRHNRLLTLDGCTMSMQQWADKIGINRRRIAKRLAKGWTVEDALRRPTHCPRRCDNN